MKPSAVPYDLRFLQDRDWPLWERLFRAVQPSLIALHDDWSEARQQGYARSAFDYQRDGAFVVNQGGQAAGILAYSWLAEPDHLYVSDLFLDPAHQGKGLGSAIMADLVGLAARRGAPVRLHALNDPATVRFYQRCGFVTYETVSDGVLMECATPKRPHETSRGSSAPSPG